jgi:tRNA1(Val) A37 N6-methylase TrmN6
MAMPDLHIFTKCDIFTPDNIAQLMSSKLSHRGSLLEPCVGTGNLLKFINADVYDEIDVYEIKEEYLQKIGYLNKIGNDSTMRYNVFHCDFIKTAITKRYDNIILNPPYIKIQDLPLEYREYINSNFELLKGGAIDIYYAFIIKCLDLLCDTGVMVSITPNSYLYNKTSYKLRKYLFDNRLIREIIDFKDKKVFSNASVYCCITIYSKEQKSHLIYNDTSIAYNDIVKNYSLFNFNSSENTLKTLCIIRNGIATLRNNVYIHSTKLYDEPCWKQITNGSSTKYIIYPYKDGKIIDEETFKKENALTFEYLVKNKDELEKRDNGKKTYPMWYAYGRSQSIKYVKKKCIYIPCFIDPNTICDNLFTHENILHYSCLCLEPNDENDIDDIKDVITNNIEFIKNNSSKRSAGWINLNSTLLYNLPLY